MSTSLPPRVNLNESRAGKVTTVIILCPALAFVTVILRLYTRFVLEKKRFLEDYFIALAMLSIMLQYVRISVMPVEKRLCYIIITILVIQNISMIVVQLSLCSPFEALWNRHLPGAKCLNTTTTYTVTLSLIIAMDFSILILPASILRHLTLRWHQKLVIAIVLSFGSLACIVSILRLTSLRASTQSTDITWNKVYSAFYAVIEINTGILCSCVVTLRPLFRRHLPFVGSRLDGLGQRHISLKSWNSRFGRAPTQRSNTTEPSDKPRLVTEVEPPTDKGTISVEAQSTLSYNSA
ncbi:hypothetical protein GQ44DRAFT_634273 [Phaeosphaeriaceae sp. PMI808]|nr:hypothetical protein GQ44DRAFT_634273 [Phaeosphaeriaceae sp. PMI808]